jgi:uncharacterized protein (DUF58 family)
MIDWKVTARSGTAHTKLFVEERERPVLLVVDFRANMRFATQGMYKSMLAVRLAALLGWWAVAARDRVGGFIFTDDWHSEIRPQAGRLGLMSLFRAIGDAQKHVPRSSSGQFHKSLRRLRHAVHAGSTVVLLSDFHGFDETARKTLGNSLHAMDLLAVHVCDRLDYQLPPPGRYPVRALAYDDNAQFVLSVGSEQDRQRYADKFLAQQQSIKGLFAERRHGYFVVSTHESVVDSAARILSRQQGGGDITEAGQ